MDDQDDIRAYHGTPHDFDRFDLSKIGTGQGQQAYGHGLYFASDEDLARSYRDDLSSGVQVLDDRPVSEIAREAIKADQPSSEQRIAQYVSQYGRMARNVMSMREPQLLDQYDELTTSQRLKPAGKMYEVRIKAHPDTMLDWDKPLLEQPAVVKMLQEQHANLDPNHEKFKFLNDAHNNMMNERSYGSHAHHYLKLALGSEGASQYLNGLGVKGIKYRDSGSRGMGGGTTNYVIFDDSLVNIARKYRKGGAVQSMATGGEVSPRYLNMVHKNPSAATLRNLTKNSPSENARIAIDHDGNLWAAAADKFLHQDLGDGERYENPGNHAVVGYVKHQDGNYIYGAWDKGSSFKKASSHPQLDRLDKSGFTNGSANSGQFSTFAAGGEVGDETPYHQTPEFQNWFGNSVAHTDGVPTTYYHGTSKDKDYTSFNIGKHGLWLTADPAEASSYAEQNDSQGYTYDDGKYVKTNTASRVLPVHIKAENPYRGDKPEELFQKQNYKKAQSDWFEQLRSQGYDSWIPDSQKGALAVILKAPTQVKSIYNRTFDPKNKRMDKAPGGSAVATMRRMSDPAVNEAIRVINRSGSSPRDAVTLSKRLLGRQ